MKKFALAAAAVAALGLAVPSFADTAEARTVTVVKPAHHHVVVTKSVRDFSARPHRCRVVIVKKRIGHRVVVNKVRRCW